ncbi:MAG: calcium-binding protein [Sphingomicrobium sp.]
MNLLADVGTYNISTPINLTHGGSDTAAVTVQGISSAGLPMNILIHGNRMDTYVAGGAAGSDVFHLFAGANNLVFQGMNFDDVGMAFLLGGDLRNITLQNMTATNVRYFTETYAANGSPTASVAGLTLRNIDVHGFSKSVALLKYDSHDILIENVHGDSEYQDGDHFAMGVALQDTVHNVIIRDSSMDNCIANSTDPTVYTNGDGFASEIATYNIQFVNVSARGNGDGGFDLKSTNVTLTNCYAEDNKRNYRFWGDGIQLIDSYGVDPHQRIAGAPGVPAQIWISSAATNIQVIGGYFADSGTATYVAVSEGGAVKFSGTHIWHSILSVLAYGSNVSGIDMSLVQAVASTGSYSTNGETYLPAASTTTTATTTSTAPADADAAANSINENVGAGTYTGVTLSGASSYLLVDNAGGRFAIDGAGRIVSTGSALDYETAKVAADGSHYYDVAVSAGSGSSATTTFTINVANQVEHLFTGGNDGSAAAPVNFNLLADGAFDFDGFQYLAGGGDDFVILPNLASVDNGNPWDYTKTFDAGAGNDVVQGGNGNDLISGGDGADRLFGGSGTDRLDGGLGNDVLVGGAGADVLSGSSGNDVFVFTASDRGTKASSPHDVITDFQHGDLIDLSALYSTHAIGWLRGGKASMGSSLTNYDVIWYSTGGKTYVVGDCDGVAGADFAIELTGTQKLTSADFITSQAQWHSEYGAYQQLHQDLFWA